MITKNKEVMEIAKEIIKKYFPSYEGIKVDFSISKGRTIEIYISESNYLADKLSEGVEIEDIAELVFEKLSKHGDYYVVEVIRSSPLSQWRPIQLNKLALCC